ncbi:MAG: GNAT family protein [Kofleriaceae bacterium]
MSSDPPRADIPVLSALPLEITGSKFTLRPVAVSDVDALYPYVTDPELPKYMSWRPHRDRAESTAFFQSQVDGLAAGKLISWAIVPSSNDGNAAGLITLGGITWKFSTDWRVDRAELGYWLGPAFWGKGIMREAAMLATVFGFETLGLHKITIGHMDGNVPSQRIIEGLGYRHVGLKLEDAWKNGAWQHHHRYEMLKSEFSDTTRTLRFSRPRQP